MSEPIITSNTPITINDENFKKVADDITTAAEMLVIASLCLRVSYIIGKKHDELSDIRKRVYINAKIYDDKVMPFTKDAVTEIKSFCISPGIKKNSTFLEFKDNIEILKNEVNTNVQLCEIIKIFHEAILAEFKRIQDDTSRLNLKSDLSKKEYEEKKKLISSDKYNWAAGLALIPDVRSSILPILGIKIDEEQISQLDDSLEIVAAIDAMHPLTESIENYIKSLNKVTGFFNILLSNLTILEKKIRKKFINDNEGKFYFEIIQGTTRDIHNACETYLVKVIDYTTNIDCIKEAKETYAKSEAKEWVLKTVKNKNMYDEFTDLLNERPNLERKLLKA